MLVLGGIDNRLDYAREAVDVTSGSIKNGVQLWNFLHPTPPPYL
jgi:hypothetical protein